MREVVDRAWGTRDQGLVVGLRDLITNCGRELQSLDSSYFGDLPREIERCKCNLGRLQALPLTEENCQAVRSMENRVAALLRKEELFWFQWSLVNWMGEGYRNTEFFHRIASGRRRRNHIATITDDDDDIVWGEEEDIEILFLGYFAKLFAAKEELDMGEVVDIVECRVTNEMQQALGQPFTEDEVVKAISQMNPTKSPRPNGMSAIFYHKY